MAAPRGGHAELRRPGCLSSPRLQQKDDGERPAPAAGRAREGRGKAPRRGWSGEALRGRGGLSARCRCSCARSRGERIADISACHPQEISHLGVISPLPWALQQLGATLRAAALRGARPRSSTCCFGVLPSTPHLRYWGVPLSPPPTALRCSPLAPHLRCWGAPCQPLCPWGEGSDTAPRPQLDGKVTLSKTRQLISLPRRDPAPGDRCSLAGWGLTDPDGRELSPTLQELEVTVMDLRMCNNSRFWKGEIFPSMICFQGKHRGSAPAKVSLWGSLGMQSSAHPQPGCGGLWGGAGEMVMAMLGVPVPWSSSTRQCHPLLRVTRGARWCAGSGRQWPA